MTIATIWVLHFVQSTGLIMWLHMCINIACIKYIIYIYIYLKLYNYKLSVAIAIGKVLQWWPTSVSHCHTATSLPPQQQQHMTMLMTTTPAMSHDVAIGYLSFLFFVLFFKKILIFLLDTNKFNDEASNDDTGHTMMWPAGGFFISF